MRIDQIALLFALVIAANLVLFIALQLPFPGRRGRGGEDPVVGSTSDGRAGTNVASERGRDGDRSRAGGFGAGLPSAVYQRMTRVVSFMFIGSAMAIVVLTDTANETAIIVLLAFGLIVIELFQDVLPPTALGRWRLPVEAATALVFLTVLIGMTGGHESPYFFGYVLLVGAAALTTAGVWAAILAVASSASYIVAIVAQGGLGIDGSLQALTSEDIGEVAFNLVVIAVVMYVASVVGREQRRAREEALRLSRFDPLTRLFSRAHFAVELEQETLRASRTGRAFAVAMVDLDGLKAANDRFGHEWGDQLLRAVADVVSAAIRVTDVAARYGGDEFVLMLPETDLTGAIKVAEKVRVDISRVALPHNGAVVRTSASIGVVTFPDDGRTSAELMRRADMAMYEAKRRGRDQIVRFARDIGAPVPRPKGQQSHEPAAEPPAQPTDVATVQAPEALHVPPASPGQAPWEPA